MYARQVTYPPPYAEYYPYDSWVYSQRYPRQHAGALLHSAGHHVPRGYEPIMCGPRHIQ